MCHASHLAGPVRMCTARRRASIPAPCAAPSCLAASSPWTASTSSRCGARHARVPWEIHLLLHGCALARRLRTCGICPAICALCLAAALLAMLKYSHHRCLPSHALPVTPSAACRDMCYLTMCCCLSPSGAYLAMCCLSAAQLAFVTLPFLARRQSPSTRHTRSSCASCNANVSARGVRPRDQVLRSGAR